jgi:hypothetical protein
LQGMACGGGSSSSSTLQEHSSTSSECSADIHAPVLLVDIPSWVLTASTLAARHTQHLSYRLGCVEPSCAGLPFFELCCAVLWCGALCCAVACACR